MLSGDLQGPAVREALEQIVKEDPRNGQMQMRLAFVLQDAGECGEAIPHFEAAVAAAVASAEPYLGLAECLRGTGRRDVARRALMTAERLEPDNPIVGVNLALAALEEGRVPEAIQRLRAALEQAPDLHDARFALMRAYRRNNQPEDAMREAKDLLARLPQGSPRRAEVERLFAAAH